MTIRERLDVRTQAAKLDGAIELPIGFGLSVVLETRFFKITALAMFVYVCACCMGNAWLYLLVSGFVTLIVLGFWLPLFEISDLDVDASMPEGVMVGADAELKIRVRKRFAFFPLSWLLPLRAMRISVSAVRRSLPRQTEQVILSPQPMLVDAITDEVWLGLPMCGLRRGVYHLKSIEIMSCYPFGLTWWKRTIRPKADVHGRTLTFAVHPHCVELKGDFLRRLPGTNSLLGFAASEALSAVQSTNVRGVREFRSGDSIRHIHWASTAKLGKLFVREFDSESLPVFDLFLDLEAPWSSREQFELAVCSVQSFVQFSYNQGHLPSIYFNPPLDSPELQSALMFDLPKLAPGLDLVAEILSRVEPLNLWDSANRQRLTSGNRVGDLSLVASCELVSAVPSNLVRETSESKEAVRLITLPRKISIKVGSTSPGDSKNKPSQPLDYWYESCQCIAEINTDKDLTAV